MSNVSRPVPIGITTLQGIEEYAEETGQDFFDLLLERLEVLHESKMTEIWEASQRLGVPTRSFFEPRILKGLERRFPEGMK